MKTLIATILFFTAAANQAQAETCAEKKSKIQLQIQQAQANQELFKIRGLEKALRGVEENCSDENLAEKHQAKIRDKQADVAKAEADLKQAERKRDAEKIRKKSEKLEIKKLELQDTIRDF